MAEGSDAFDTMNKIVDDIGELGKFEVSIMRQQYPVAYQSK